MSAHAAKSPSQADRFAKCSGALALCDALPAHQKNLSGPAAKLGTCAHAIIELCLGKKTEPESLRGRIVTIVNEGDSDEHVKVLPKSAKTPTGQYWAEVDDDLIDGCTVMTDYVRARIAELGPSTELELESRTNPLPDRDDTSGTADVTLKSWPVVLEVVDYKNGWNWVEHFGNLQLLAYLLGKALESDFDYSRYTITVVQPNAEAGEDGKHHRSFSATADELRAFQDKYREYVEACDVAAEAKGAPKPGKAGPVINESWAAKYLVAAKSGEKDHCMFCDAKAICPAYINRRANEAAIDFADEPVDFEAPNNEADVAKILRWKPAFDALFKAAWLYGQRSLENGFDVPGFKLAMSKPHRRWLKLSEDELAAMLMKKFKLTPEQIYVDKLKTGPQVEKLLPKNQRQKFSETMLFNPAGVPTIVPAEDKREAAVARIDEDFPDDLNSTDFG
jgi:hypothetical protein